MANNKIPSRGAKLLAVSGQETNFLIYRDLSKTGDKRPATDFDRVVSSGTIVCDNTGSPWLVVFGYKHNMKESTGHVLVDDSGIMWQDQPIESTPALPIPGFVRANFSSDGKGVLSWAPVSGAAVEIEVAPTAQGPYRLVAVFNDGAGEYSINRLTEGNGLYYRLRSSNEYADSAYSVPFHVVGDRGSDSAPVVKRKINAQPEAKEACAVMTETENGQTANLSADEPIIGWMRTNIQMMLAIGAAVIVALMMVAVARRP